MSATVIILPVVPRATAIGDLEHVTLQVRLQRRALNRLAHLATQWDIGLTSAAELLLTEAINERSGMKRR